MTKSTYSRPSSSHTRQPDARVMRAGVPNNASGRLLPVDVKPGTRQSFTVFGHLDGHRAQQLRLARVQRRAMSDLAHRSHDAGLVARLEEVDRLQRAGHVLEQTLQLPGLR